MKNQELSRKIASYQVLHAIRIGDSEVLFCEDPKEEQRYMCCYYHTPEQETSNAQCSADYLDMMELFGELIDEQVRRVYEARVSCMNRIDAEMCFPDDVSKNIVDKVVALRADTLAPEYQTGDRQLYLVTHGSGALANPSGTIVFGINLYNETSACFSREDVQGEVKPECLPDWAKDAATRFENE